MSPTPPNESLPDFPTRIFTFLGVLYFVLLGCVIAYLWLLAQDRFISVATFKISRQSTSTGELGLGALALPGLSDSGSLDSQIAIGFIESTDLLLQLEKDFNLRDHFSSPAKDLVFRLDRDALLEKRLDYYRERITANYDKETGMTILSIDTFDPQLSKKLAEAILTRTEDFTNDLNQDIADQQLTFIRTEVERADQNVRDMSLKLLDLQNSHNLVSPDEVIAANLKALEELRMEHLRTETSLSMIERDSPESPRIETFRSRLRSLNEQIALESAKISGPEQDRLNQILAQYKDLTLKLGFATQMRTGAETLLEKHRIDAAARSRFISIIQKPYLPEDVGYPERPYATITILVLGVLLFLMLRIMIHSVYERVN